MTRMRILFIHTIGRKKLGGGEHWVLNAAVGLQHAGHQCIVASKGNSRLLQEATEKGIETLAINIFSDISIYHALKIARMIKKRSVDLVISKRRDLAVAGMAARWAGKVPVIVRSGVPPQKSLRKHVFLIRKLAHGLVTNTNTIREIYLANSLPNNNFIRVIHNGISLDDKIEAFDFNEKLRGKTILLCAGRLNNQQKGYTYLIDALQLLKKDHPNLYVYVLGEGKDRNMLEAYARHKGVAHMICFAGHVDQPAKYMKGCDVFIHPALFEGMPNAAMEAMAYGKPVIMTNVNGAAELSNNGQFAEIIPPANHSAIARSIEKVLADTHIYKAMADLAKIHVRKNFTMKQMVDGLESFIYDVSKR